ncbi:MAG: hypothetical protein IH989_07315 [Planctomycetes bacterium]|nr:hypothetical protein [Planctomycetota bacterium]
MGQVLEALHRLQTIERQLAEIRRQREAKSRRVAHHQGHVRKVEEALRRSKLVYQERRRRLDALQLDSAARDQALDRHRQALNAAKTNKEYAAILTAMNTEKADNSKLETEILQLLEETQTLEATAAKGEEERIELLEQVSKAEEVLKDLEAKTQPEHDALQAQREESTHGIPPSTLVTFQRVAVRHDGEVLATVAKLHPKRDEYVCSGCNLMITLEVVNQLGTRDDLQVCKACGRILFLEEPAQQAT